MTAETTGRAASYTMPADDGPGADGGEAVRLRQQRKEDGGRRHRRHEGAASAEAVGSPAGQQLAKEPADAEDSEDLADGLGGIAQVLEVVAEERVGEAEAACHERGDEKGPDSGRPWTWGGLFGSLGGGGQGGG